MGLAASLRSRSGQGVSAESRLALLEFLMGGVDLDASVRYALDWLGAYAGVRQSVCALIDVTETQLLGIAEHGAQATTWEFSLPLHDHSHPLIQTLRGGEPRHFDSQAARAWSPLDGVALHAIPLRGAGPDSSVEGVLIVDAISAELSGDLRWFTDILGQQVSRLRRRHAVDDGQGGREVMLLYNSINAVTDPILITDPEGKLIIANARAEKLFTSPEDASEGWRQAVGLNNMLFSAALSSSAMETEGTSRRELALVDSIEGSDLLFELLSSVVKDPREGTFVVSILRNVTDLGRATEEIEESHRRLRIAQAEIREERHRLDLIIDSVVDPILVTDPAGDIVMMNAPAEKLFTEAQRGERVRRRVEANGVHFSSFVSSMLASGSDRRWRGDIGLIDPETGSAMPFEAMAGKILSDQGELTWIVTILHDLTETVERARLYEQLKRASKELEGKVQAATAELAQQNELLRRQALELEQASALKTQFLANMSHEFRTPLNAILGYTHMLLHGVSGPMTTPQKNSLIRIDSNGRHLLALINEILDISRIEAGRMPMQITDFRLPELVGEVMSELDPIVVRSRLDVTISVSPDIPALRSDRQKVKQIVLNLLSNALKFTQRGWIRIDATPNPQARTVTIAVSDTGIGIAPDDQEKVFEDFRQLNVSASRGYGGTGLGLAICRRLADTLGGTITLESALGQGSTFSLTLPLRLRKNR